MVVASPIARGRLLGARAAFDLRLRNTAAAEALRRRKGVIPERATAEHPRAQAGRELPKASRRRRPTGRREARSDEDADVPRHRAARQSRGRRLSRASWRPATSSSRRPSSSISTRWPSTGLQIGTLDAGGAGASRRRSPSTTAAHRRCSRPTRSSAAAGAGSSSSPPRASARPASCRPTSCASCRDAGI